MNLDMRRTRSAFVALMGGEAAFEAASLHLHASGVLEGFETGRVSEAEFVAALQGQAPSPVSADSVREAWSAMLLNLPEERLHLLNRLRSRGYALFLLSNINEIHLRDFYRIVRSEQGADFEFDALFNRTYYSHLIGRRKPNEDTYRFVLHDAGIEAEETLFVDDLPENVEGALKAGLGAVLHGANGDVETTLRRAGVF